MKKELMFLLALGYTALGADDSALVTQLPGCDPFAFNVYSGYLQARGTKQLHYVFVESKDDPSTDPVTIWFNGGPMCSSMLGFMQEHGPCIIDDGETVVKENPWPWNYRANMLYLESPAGVGFSYLHNPDDVKTNDMQQSIDAYEALVSFYELFPEFLPNDLYLTGESYAGIYVPYLAWQIYQHNLQAGFDAAIQELPLKGIAVGNGIFDYLIDVWPAFVPTAYNFNMITKDVYDRWVANDCLFTFNNALPTENTLGCIILFDDILIQTQDFNIYDLYRMAYPDSLSLKSGTPAEDRRMGEVEINGVKKTYKRGFTVKEYTPWHPLAEKFDHILLGDYVTDYLNQEDVRTALHIPTEAPAYEGCKSQDDYHYQEEASRWIYDTLRGHYRILIYSGDTDGIVSNYGTRTGVRSLNWGITEEWRPWMTDGQVSGFIEKHDGLDFVTVHGVGHMSPQWKRKDVTMMISAWLHSEEIVEFN